MSDDTSIPDHLLHQIVPLLVMFGVLVRNEYHCKKNGVERLSGWRDTEPQASPLRKIQHKP
eukprot:517112-Pelagomonas_calceolata.AAC.2